MTWPAYPRDLVAELFVGGTWVDVTSDVYQRGAVQITRGLQNEQASTAEASTCKVTLNNRTGDYSPRNPTGAYYGSLGRNTPFRLAVRSSTDAFGRTSSSSWGSTDTGQVWSALGSGGSVLNSDFNVSGGKGTHSVPTTTAYRFTYLGSTSYRDVDVRVDASLALTSITGGAVEPANILLRGQSSTNYYMVRVSIAAGGAITVALMHADGTVYAAATSTGLTYSSSLTMRVRAQAEGDTLRAKVWDASGSEPYGWTVTAHTTTISAAGWVGVRSGVSASNSNTRPIVFSYDSWEVKLPRFAGEISEWPPQWDTSGTDITTQVEASGPLRRLGQGASPVQSTLRRAIPTEDPPPIAYWSCEDSAGSTALASALGGTPMQIFGSPSLAADSSFACSAPLPQLKLSSWVGDVPADLVTGNAQARFLMAVPSGGAGVDNKAIFRMDTAGTAVAWSLYYYTGGALGLSAYDVAGNLLASTGAVAFNVDGQLLRVSIELTQSGSDIHYGIVTLAVGATTGGFTSGTLTSNTIVRPTRVFVNPESVLDDVVMGHVAVYSTITSIFDLAAQLKAYDGEDAATRISRLCSEAGIAYSYRSGGVTPSLMGPQQVDTLLNLLSECAAADVGMLYESKGSMGLAYRTRSSLYSQDATLALDYAQHELVQPFQPISDDANTRNDITVSRRDGSSVRVQQTTGPLNTSNPEDGTGGVGRYSAESTLNVQSDDQLPDLGSWLLHLGTVDEDRYPQITVDLGNQHVSSSTDLVCSVLDADTGDRLTIANPKAGQDPNTITQIVRGYSETINTFEHLVAFTSGPESPYKVAVLDNTEYVKLGSDDSTLTSDITSGATSISVTVAGSTLWTTDAGQMPIPILVGGEEMSVTAISGSSSPQTFTVTRSQNGVTKAHKAGDAVTVKYPAVLAL